MAAMIPLLVGKVGLSSLTTEDQKPVSRAQGVNLGCTALELTLGQIRGLV